VEDGWLKKMEVTPKRDNMGRLRPGTVLSYAYIKKVLTVLGQCFQLAIEERPPLLEVNPAPGIRLPKQDRREMDFLDEAAAYAALRDAMHEHFRPCRTSWSAPGPATGRPPDCWCATCTWTPRGPTSTSGWR
jgi:hypothetical protein